MNMGARLRLVTIVAAMLLCAIMADAKKPLIGISCGGNVAKSNVNASYYNAVIKAGGIPVLLPLTKDEAAIERIVKKIDGIVFTGGEDYDPAIYGEERIPELGTVNGFRDTSDIAFARTAIKMKKPILAICRGEQLINIVCGGTLYQDLPSQKNVIHRQTEPSSIPTHGIKVEKNSLLHDIMGSERLEVNTFHHQAVKDLGDGLRITAMSDDGVVEAYQSTGRRPRILALQFHPERLREGNEAWTAIFEWLVKSAR